MTGREGAEGKGGGGATKREGARQVLQLDKVGGGHKTFSGSLDDGHFSLSHTRGGGWGHKMVHPLNWKGGGSFTLKKGGGGKQTRETVGVMLSELLQEFE